MPVEELRRRAAPAPDHNWFADGEPPVVLAAGRLTRQKDFPTLLRAFARARAGGAHARMLILGEGEDRPALEGLRDELGLAADVALPGFTADPYPYFGHAALYALSSGWEGLPTVLVECLAVGLPVVSTDCPSGPREILRGGRLGALVPVGDAAALGDAIAAALVRPAPVPPDAVDPYRTEAVVAAYRELIERIAAPTG